MDQLHQAGIEDIGDLVDDDHRRALEALGRFRAIKGKTWNHPVIAHGRLFVRNATEMACYELRLEGAR